MSAFRKEEVSLRPGEKFSVIFNEMAGAGYLWTMSENKSRLRVTMESPPPGKASETETVGGPHELEMSVSPQTPGTYELEFVHKRPWEQEAIETVRYVLHVKP